MLENPPWDLRWQGSKPDETGETAAEARAKPPETDTTEDKESASKTHGSGRDKVLKVIAWREAPDIIKMEGSGGHDWFWFGTVPEQGNRRRMRMRRLPPGPGPGPGDHRVD